MPRHANPKKAPPKPKIKKEYLDLVSKQPFNHGKTSECEKHNYIRIPGEKVKQAAFRQGMSNQLAPTMRAVIMIRVQCSNCSKITWKEQTSLIAHNPDAETAVV